MNTFRMTLTMLAALALSACASMAGPNMDAAQIKEIVKDKSGSVVCATVMGPWGTGKTVVVNLDSGVVRNGGVTVDPNCVVTVTTTANPPKEAAPAAPAK